MNRGYASRMKALRLAAALAAVAAGYPAFAQAPADETCAESLILAAAKNNVAARFHNAPESGGRCAFGVRTSLQLSGVGGVKDGLGNAVDYLNSLPPHGFVDSGVRDPNTAPPGSVVVFAGPYSPQYLADGRYGVPAGNWLGHVTIKGDDGYYYTDGRTVEPALGWEKGVDVSDIRVVAGVFVPGPALTAAYAGACPKPTVFAGTVAAESNARLSGHRRAWDVARRLSLALAMKPGSAARSASFLDLLPDARRAMAYDAESALAQSLARAIRDDADLRAAYDGYVRSLGGPDCATQRLTRAVARAACLDGAGQDEPGLSGGSARDCPEPFDVKRCESGG